VYLKPDTWVIWDDLSAEARHTIELRLHLPPDCGVSVDQGDPRIVLTSPHGQRLFTRLTDTAGQDLRAVLAAGTDDERTAWLSPAYGVRIPAHALVVRRNIEGSFGLVTALSLREDIAPRVFEQDGGLEVTVTRPTGSTDTLWCRTSGDTPLARPGLRFDGELLFRRDASLPGAILRAESLRELSIDGLLDLESPGVINSVEIEGRRCRVTLPVALRDRLKYAASDGMEIVFVAGTASPNP
jgi:hypothetical protein